MTKSCIALTPLPRIPTGFVPPVSSRPFRPYRPDYRKQRYTGEPSFTQAFRCVATCARCAAKLTQCQHQVDARPAGVLTLICPLIKLT